MHDAHDTLDTRCARSHAQVVRGILSLAAKAMPSSSTANARPPMNGAPGSSGSASVFNTFAPGGRGFGPGGSAGTALATNPRNLRVSRVQ